MFHYIGMSGKNITAERNQIEAVVGDTVIMKFLVSSFTPSYLNYWFVTNTSSSPNGAFTFSCNGTTHAVAMRQVEAKLLCSRARLSLTVNTTQEAFGYYFISIVGGNVAFTNLVQVERVS